MFDPVVTRRGRREEGGVCWRAGAGFAAGVAAGGTDDAAPDESPEPGVVSWVPSIGIASPHFLHFIRARFPATLASGTLNFAEQEGQRTSMSKAGRWGRLPALCYHGLPLVERLQIFAMGGLGWGAVRHEAHRALMAWPQTSTATQTRTRTLSSESRVTSTRETWSMVASGICVSSRFSTS